MISFTIGVLVGLYLEQEYDLPSVKTMTEFAFNYMKQVIEQYGNKTKNTNSITTDTTISSTINNKEK
jgi:hypothetical protein